jgi:hypothetical protein
LDEGEIDRQVAGAIFPGTEAIEYFHHAIMGIAIVILPEGGDDEGFPDFPDGFDNRFSLTEWSLVI